MKRILITHDDLDGAGCAILFKQVYPDIEIQHHDYKTIDEVGKNLWDNRSDYDGIFFADISPSEEIGLKMLNDPKFAIIDHHKTREYLIGSPHFDTNKSGTCLSWEFFSHRGYISNFVCGIDAWDIWDLDSIFRPLGEDLNLLFGYYGMDAFVSAFEDMREISNNEKVIVEVLEKLNKDYLTEKRDQAKVYVDLNGNRYLEVYVGEKRSGLGNIFELDDIPDVEYLECINLNDGVVSLYSLGFDVAEIAKRRGGGGHTRAAGYTM